MAGTNQGTAAIFTEIQSPTRAYFSAGGFEVVIGHGPGQPVDVGNETYNAFAATIGTALADGYTATTRSMGIASTPVNQGAAYADPDKATAMQELWFEKVHILPRTKIEFGNIITQKTDQYEVYNALRSADVTTNSLTNNVSPGVTFPDESLPEVIESQSSALDSTTTGQTSIPQALGTMVQRDVVASQDGLPIFDSNVVFNMSAGNDVELLLSGQRLVLMPMEYEAPVGEMLAFLTDIIPALDGKEQRIALRKQPRQIFEVTYKLDAADRQRMQSLLMDWTDNSFGFPLWHEKLRLTAAVSAGATVYTVANTADVDIRAGGLAVVFTDNNTFDVISIASLTSTTITSNDPSVNAYPVGTTIMPMRTAQILRAVAAEREQVELETFKVTFEVTDNDTGALTGDVSAYSTYNSRVLLDDCNVMLSDKMGENYSRRIYRIDNATGKTSISSTWDQNKRNAEKGFVLRNRAEIITFRRLMIALRGRQTSFYMPTMIEDLTVKATLGIGGDTMDIDNIEYERFVQSRFPKTIFKITFTDGTSLIREVQSATGVDSSTERLTLDTTWPATRTVDEVQRVEFYELVRFDADNVMLKYPRIGLAECKMPVVQVFDDN